MTLILETDRLVLRTWTLDDASDALRIWGDAEVMRFVGAPFPDVGVARRALERAIAVQEEHGVCLWAVVEKAGRRIVGCSGFHLYEGGPALELAFHFVPEYWGRGYATEAARACLRHAFERLHAPKVVATVHPENVASRRVLEKVGFIYTHTEEREGEAEMFFEAAPPEGAPLFNR